MAIKDLSTAELEAVADVFLSGIPFFASLDRGDFRSALCELEGAGLLTADLDPHYIVIRLPLAGGTGTRFIKRPKQA